jgi:hypothetical protein
MLAEDRERAGWSVEQAGAARRERATHQEIEAGSPEWETWDAISKTFGWRWPLR